MSTKSVLHVNVLQMMVAVVWVVLIFHKEIGVA